MLADGGVLLSARGFCVGVGVSDSDIWLACGCGPSVWVSPYMCAVFVAALLALGRLAGFVAALLAPLLAALGRQNFAVQCAVGVSSGTLKMKAVGKGKTQAVHCSW